MHAAKFFKIDGALLHFLASYIKDRHQRVSISNKMSSNLIVNCGVSQGSILDPLLSFPFINYILCGLSDNTDITLYIDETKICWRIDVTTRLVYSSKRYGLSSRLGTEEQDTI